MNKSFNTVTEQVTQALKEGLRQGRWQGTIPGRNRLAAELGVNPKTVKAALGILEKEGLLQSRGPGRERLIVESSRAPGLALRIVIMPFDSNDRNTDYLMEIVHRLQLAGHLASFATKTLADLGRNVTRVARYVERTDADAWIVIAAPRDILDWFAEQPLPAFGLFGPVSQVPISSTGPTKTEALNELMDRLLDFGHRRIVLLSREDRRKPHLGPTEGPFLDKLTSRGIQTGPYNLPDWGSSPEGLQKNITSLFRHTPPTALIVDDPILFLALFQHLGHLGITAPDRISLACTDHAPAFDWCRPKITHIAWNRKTVVNRVVSWTNQISSGKGNLRKTLVRAELIPGGTIGPLPKAAGRG